MFLSYAWEQYKLGQMCSEFQSGDFISADRITQDGVYALIGRQGALCGNMNISYGKAYFTEHAVAVAANSSHDTEFLFYLFGILNLGQYSGQSAQPGLAVSKLITVSASTPKLNEQRQISGLLLKFDRLITLHQRKLDKLHNVKKSLLEKMFPINGADVPEIRFSGFTYAWEQRKLGSIADKVTEKNGQLSYSETFTNSAEFGIISQRDFFDHDISNSENIGGYYVVRENDFVYNPRISVTAPCGPINCNRLGKNGVMSPLYTVFKTHDIDTLYLEWFFKSSYWHSFMYYNGDSGARSDRFSIKNDLFFMMPIPVPTEEEQRRIGSLLSTLDKAITLHQRKLEKLRQIKKALLEKMFV